jgi:hypothetical protein
MSKLKFLEEMVAEMEARKRSLLAEKKALENAVTRIAEIDALVFDIDTELGQMRTKADAVRPEVKP